MIGKYYYIDILVLMMSTLTGFRYALEGSPFQINIFFGQPDGKDFHDLGSRNFVASVFNFSSAIKNSNCGNCIEQKKRGIYSEAQLPATLAVWSHQELEKTNKEPEVFYVVVNSRGEVRYFVSII